MDRVRRYDAAVASVLPETAALVGVLFVVYAFAHPIVLGGRDGWVMAALAAISAVAMFVLAYLTWRRPVRLRYAHPATAFVAVVLGVNALTHVAITASVVQTTNVMLAIVAVGAALLDRRWAAGVVAAYLVAWTAVAIVWLDGVDLSHWVFALVMATLLGAVLNDIRRRGLDQLEEALTAAQAAAVHDELTGLLNRRGLSLLGPALVASARRAGNAVYASFVDVDGLKTVNDGAGHSAGDAVLVAVADALAGVVRAGDLVCRIGGDEFCVLGQGPGAAPVDLERRIGEKLREHPPVDQRLWDAKVSVGGAMLAPWDEGDLDTLLGTADKEMYRRRSLRRRTRDQSRQTG